MHSMLSNTNNLTNLSLFDSLPVAVLIIDIHGFIHYYNHQAQQDLAYNENLPDNIGDVLTKFKWNDFISTFNNNKQTSTASQKVLMSQVMTNQEKSYQLKMSIFHQTPQYYLLLLTELLSNTGVGSEKYHLLRKSFQELKQFSRLSAMREIASSLADKLNQPLTAIISYTQAMQRLYQVDASSEEINDAMERVVVNAEYAGQIIRDIRSQVNANTLNCQNNSINELIQQCLHLTELENSAIKLVTYYDPDNTLLCVDTIQLKQVILSLLNNAIEAVSQSSVSAPEIILSTRKNDKSYEICIEDNGFGISSEIQKKLFEPFITTKKNGIGIGLSMCHHIIDLHQGDINITASNLTQKQTGTLVKIHLPYMLKDKSLKTD